MSRVTSARTELDVLYGEYRAYIDRLKADWLSQNRVNSRDIYEVMSPEEQAQVHQSIAQWGRYVTPLAEAWWRERGYGITWPTDDSEPMRLHKLGAA